MSDVTRILNAIERGDTKATDELLPLVYEELRILAAQKLSHEPPGQTLQATALVHEAYLRLVGSESRGWENHGHFFAAAAEAMRRILVENARRKKSLKRGGEGQADRLELERARELPSLQEPEAPVSSPWEAGPDDLLALDEALGELAGSEPQVVDLVKLRYFAGLTIEQIARIRGVSDRTVFNHLAYARAWLRRALRKDDGPQR
jgi:RNA polymerase sigma factor (TIGR02999 family)